jgi:superfamily I DNA and/or RNA helicase
VFYYFIDIKIFYRYIIRMPKRTETPLSDGDEPLFSETDSEKLEKPKKEKVDRRKTGGLKNRTPAQIEAYKKMAKVAAERHAAMRKAKIEKGLEIIAKKSLKQDDETEEPPSPKRTKSKPIDIKKKKPVTRLVFDEDSSSDSDTGTTIVIKKKKSKTKAKKRPATPPSSDDEEDELTPAPPKPQPRQLHPLEEPHPMLRYV